MVWVTHTQLTYTEHQIHSESGISQIEGWFALDVTPTVYIYTYSFFTMLYSYNDYMQHAYQHKRAYAHM